MIFVSMAGFEMVFPSMVKSPTQLESSSDQAPSSGSLNFLFFFLSKTLLI